MKTEELKKVVEAAKNNPDFDMNNWGECLVGSYLQDKTDSKFFALWNDCIWTEIRYTAAAEHFNIGIDDVQYLFGMREEYNDIYDENRDSLAYNPSKDARMMVREMAVERLEEFIWEAESSN